MSKPLQGFVAFSAPMIISFFKCEQKRQQGKNRKRRKKLIKIGTERNSNGHEKREEGKQKRKRIRDKIKILPDVKIALH